MSQSDDFSKIRAAINNLDDGNPFVEKKETPFQGTGQSPRAAKDDPYRKEIADPFQVNAPAPEDPGAGAVDSPRSDIAHTQASGEALEEFGVSMPDIPKAPAPGVPEDPFGEAPMPGVSEAPTPGSPEAPLGEVTDPGVPEAPLPGVSEAPIPGVPEAPMPGVPEAPMPGVPEAPMPGVPEAPFGEVPVPGVSEAPIPGVPEAPIPGVPEAPMPGVSEASIPGFSEAPFGEAPMPGVPEAPISGVPEAPMPGVPEAPFGEAPIPGVPEAPVPGSPEAPLGEVTAPGVPEVPMPGVPEAPFGEVTAPGVPEAPMPGVPEAPMPGVPEAPFGEVPVPGVPEAPVPGSPEAPLGEVTAPGVPEAPIPGVPEDPFGEVTAPGVPEAPIPGVPEAPMPGVPEAPEAIPGNQGQPSVLQNDPLLGGMPGQTPTMPGPFEAPSEGVPSSDQGELSTDPLSGQGYPPESPLPTEESGLDPLSVPEVNPEGFAPLDSGQSIPMGESPEQDNYVPAYSDSTASAAPEVVDTSSLEPRDILLAISIVDPASDMQAKQEQSLQNIRSDVAFKDKKKLPKIKTSPLPLDLLVPGTPLVGTIYSPSGGVGKSSTAMNLAVYIAAIAETMAQQRVKKGESDVRIPRVLVLDGDIAQGSLALRLKGEVTPSIHTLQLYLDERVVSGFEGENSWPSVYENAPPGEKAMRDFVMWNQKVTNLDLLAAPEEPDFFFDFGPGEYRDIIRLLSRFYDVIIIDAGTEIIQESQRAWLQHAHEVFIITAPEIDRMYNASKATRYIAKERPHPQDTRENAPKMPALATKDKLSLVTTRADADSGLDIKGSVIPELFPWFDDSQKFFVPDVAKEMLRANNSGEFLVLNNPEYAEVIAALAEKLFARYAEMREKRSIEKPLQ